MVTHMKSHYYTMPPFIFIYSNISRIGTWGDRASQKPPKKQPKFFKLLILVHNV